MPIFAAGPHLSDTDLQHLNKCRMFKKAVSLADLTTACGKFLEQSATTPQPSHALQTYIWPHKPAQLPTSYWTLWKKSIVQLFMNPTSTRLELSSPLKEWITDPTPHWKWWSHKSDSGVQTVHHKGNLYHHAFLAPYRSRRQRRLQQAPPPLSPSHPHPK